MTLLVGAGIGVALAAGIALSYWGYETVWCLLWVALLPVQLQTEALLGFRLAPCDALLAGIAGGLLLRWLGGRERRVKVNAVVLLCGAIFVWLIIAAARGADTLGYVSRYVVVNKLIGFLVMVLVYGVTLGQARSAETVTKLATWFCVTGGLWSLNGLVGFGLWRFQGLENPMVYGEGRLCGLLVDPNAFGGFLVAVLIVGLALYLKVKVFHRKILSVVNSGIVFYALLLTSSRSAWLGLIVGVVGLVLVLRRHERARLAVIGVLLTLEAVLHFSVLSPQSVALASRVPQVEARVAIAAKAVERFSLSPSPFLGIGLGVFHNLPEGAGAVIHSTYLWVLVETGIIGLMLLGALIIAFMWQFLRVNRGTGSALNVVAVGCVGCLLAWLGLMVGIEAFYQRHFWFIAGLLGGLEGMVRACHSEPARRAGVGSDRIGSVGVPGEGKGPDRAP